MASSSPQVHKVRGREGGRGASGIRKDERFLIVAHLHLTNQRAAVKLMHELAALHRFTPSQFEAMVFEDACAFIDLIPPVEDWHRLLREGKDSPTMPYLMAAFMASTLAHLGAESYAELLMPRIQAGAAFAAAVTHGMYGPPERWDRRRLTSPEMRTLILSLAQLDGLSVEAAAARCSIPASTAYRLLGKKTGS